jgi:hypothetical protein
MEANVNLSLLFVTASCLAGQAVQYQPANPGCQTCTQAAQQTAPTYTSEPEPRHRLFGRIRNLFHRHSAPEYQTQPAYQVITPTAEPPRAPVTEPAPAPAAEPSAVNPASFKQAVPAVKKEFQDKIGCAEDYKWITGQLCYVHTADGGVWVLRYAGVDQNDRYGGSVVLAPGVEMKNYREGDLVCVEGEILQDRQTPGHLGGALYRVSTISMITRSDM